MVKATIEFKSTGKKVEKEFPTQRLAELWIIKTLLTAENAVGSTENGLFGMCIGVQNV